VTSLIFWLARVLYENGLGWFKQAFQEILRFFLDATKWLVGLVLAGVIWILQTFVEDIWRAITNAAQWFMVECWDFWGSCVDLALEELPESTAPSFAAIGQLVNNANRYAPLSEGLALLSAYWAFQTAWASWFLIKRHIPTMGK